MCEQPESPQKAGFVGMNDVDQSSRDYLSGDGVGVLYLYMYNTKKRTLLM